ncbi:MAG: cell wall-active antibiotics response protein [Bacteroidia bacterium]|nr:cell wall-active antibiotics response protein [Bacteroidia bacterium]MCF8426940.1 cell wall-active antibiotics response protein [Bacteroidia bacterium]MCF8446818.1 cell wall-active antibiotics response protein [Bacteroidia bacterium]
MDDQNNSFEERHRKGRVLSGIILIIVGALFFARKLGVFFPDWLFSWPMFLVALGIYIGAKHNFKSPGWIFVTGFGLAFLTERFYPEIRIHEFFWPIFLIVMGAFIIFKPFRKHRKWEKAYGGYNQQDYTQGCGIATETNENKININAVMGGVKKIVLSKDFQGGEINCVMGGAEINLTQADINGKATLEINNVFGGTKLIVPANWNVDSDVMVVLGGVEDKRPVSRDTQNSQEKTLLLTGSCVFGGIDIKSY